MAIEIVSLPISSTVIFQFAMFNSQRVNPIKIPWKNTINPMKSIDSTHFPIEKTQGYGHGSHVGTGSDPSERYITWSLCGLPWIHLSYLIDFKKYLEAGISFIRPFIIDGLKMLEVVLHGILQSITWVLYGFCCRYAPWCWNIYLRLPQ